jgi:hypothetical protein
MCLHVEEPRLSVVRDACLARRKGETAERRRLEASLARARNHASRLQELYETEGFQAPHVRTALRTRLEEALADVEKLEQMIQGEPPNDNAHFR